MLLSVTSSVMDGHRYYGDISKKVTLNCWDPAVARGTSNKQTNTFYDDRIQKKSVKKKYKNEQKSDTQDNRNARLLFLVFSS